jgi:hypothetical protein
MTIEGVDDYNPWADVEVQEETPDFPYEDTIENSSDNNQEFDDSDDNEMSSEENQENFSAGQNEETEEIEDDINVTFFLANALKEKGIIEDSEIREDITDEEVLSLYERAHAERIRLEEENKIALALEARGITEENLQYAMAIQNGYSPEYLLEQNRYKLFSSLSDRDDIDRGVQETVIKEFHKSRGLMDDEIEDRMTDLELNDDKFETDFRRATEFFGAKYRQFEEQNQSLALEKERQMLDQQKRNRDLLYRVETTGEIGGEKMNMAQLEDFRRGIYLQEDIVEVNGQPYRVSKFEKFVNDFQNNFETQLLAYKLLTFRDMDKKIISQEAASKAEDNLFQNLRTRIVKSGGNVRPQSVVTKKGADGRTYEIPKNAKVISF